MSVLLASDDPSWLARAGDAVIREGGVVAAECPDAVSVLAQAALDLADVVLTDGRTDLDRDAVLWLRRRGLVVIEVSSATDHGSRNAMPHFADFADALSW